MSSFCRLLDFEQHDATEVFEFDQSHMAIFKSQKPSHDLAQTPGFSFKCDGGFFGIFYFEGKWFVFLKSTVFPMTSVERIDLADANVQGRCAIFVMSDGSSLRADYVLHPKVLDWLSPYDKEGDDDFGQLIKKIVFDGASREIIFKSHTNQDF